MLVVWDGLFCSFDADLTLGCLVALVCCGFTFLCRLTVGLGCYCLLDFGFARLDSFVTLACCICVFDFC